MSIEEKIRIAVKDKTPVIPMVYFSTEILKKNIKLFQKYFDGTILYSVKSNPRKEIIKILYENGIHSFDVASDFEIRLIKDIVSNAELYYMHPIKSPESIANAYYNYNIMHYTIDSQNELNKIERIIGKNSNITLHIRLEVNSNNSIFELSKKFGSPLEYAKILIEKASELTPNLVLSFHVGSQCMNISSYFEALDIVENLLDQYSNKKFGVNIGGGFPVEYANLHPRPVKEYLSLIQKFISQKTRLSGSALYCEPGRAMVANAGAVIVRIEEIRGKYIYINDGIYGRLADLQIESMIYNVSPLDSSKKDKIYDNYSLFGPTCDSYDYMPGPYRLPNDLQIGDYLIVHALGAYSESLASKFNGYHESVFYLD